MLRSLFTGISGLSVHQTMLDVTSNNIANVNTTGFKSASTRFEDTFSQLVKSGATARLNERGGMNPAQVGLGVKLQSITNNFTGGAAQNTGRNLDTMINGDGFFVLKKTNGTQVYTRNGSFGLDAKGQVVAADGSFVQGWKADKKGKVNASGGTSNLVLPLTETMKAEPTRDVIFGGNMPADKRLLDPSKEPTSDNAFTKTQNLRVFDDKGTPHDILMEFTREDIDGTGTGSKWRVRFYDQKVYNALPKELRQAAQIEIELPQKNKEGVAIKDLDKIKKDMLSGKDDDKFDNVLDGGKDNTGKPTGNPVKNPKDLLISFDSQGQISKRDKEVLANLKMKISNYGEVVSVDDNGTKKYGFKADKVAAEDVTIDMSKLTGYAGVNNFAVDQVDGNDAGTLNGFGVEADGTIRGTFSNGMSRAMGKIATAAFSNPLGLEKAGASYFVESGNSGQPQIGEPGSGSRGAMTGGAIEMSNVDLAAEFTNLILSQRGFQANTRVITTSDEILQELVSMKR